MAIVRCNEHPVNKKQAKNDYIRLAKPIGYPNTAVICGRAGCIEPGNVWLTDDEVSDYNRGERYFRVKTYTIKVKIEEGLSPLPN